MKRLLIALGLIFILLVVAIAALVGYAAFTGGKLDKESRAYVDAAVPAIVSSWNEQELLSRASPEFQRAASPADVDRLFRWFRTLGRLQKYEGTQGQTVTSVTPQTGKVVTGRYIAKAVFDAGGASIQIDVIRHGSVWQIEGFKINSSALAPNKM
jgi:hypothetical protein